MCKVELTKIPRYLTVVTIISVFIFECEISWAQIKTQVLPETLVTATLEPISPKNLGNAVAVITAEDIEQRGATYVPDLLRDIPGLAVSKSGPNGGFTQVRMRGTEANQLLFLIDGIEANDPNTSEPYWGDVIPGDIERIEILRGSQSSIHGSDAIGGVIHIITKRGKGKPRVTGSIELGSFDTFRGRSGFSGSTTNSHYAFNVMAYRTSGVSAARPSADNPGPNEKDGYENITLSTKLGMIAFENLDLETTGRFVRSRADLDSFSASSCCHDMIDNETKIDKRTEFLIGTKGTYDLFEKVWSHKIKTQWSENHKNTFEDGFVTFKSVGRKIKLGYSNTLRISGSDFAKSEHTFTSGIETEYEKTIGTNFKKTRDQDGFFGEYQLRLFEDLTLFGSARHDRNDVFEDVDTWSGAIAYNIPKTKTKLRASYGKGVKNPTFSELFGSDDNFVGNPNLKPESNESYDIGIDQSFSRNRIKIGTTFFLNRVKDLISGSGNTSTNSLGTTKIWGSELSMASDVTEDLSINAAYTYTNHEDPNGRELTRRPKHIASTNVEYQLKDKKTRLYLAIDYNGTQADNDFEPTFTNTTRVQLKAFTNITVGGSYQITEGVSIKARIENVLNDQYEEVFGFQSPGIGAFIGVSADF